MQRLHRPARGALLHDERAQRAGFGLVEASTADTDVRLDRWRFVRDAGSGEYRGTIPARSFDLTLSAQPTQPLLLQGRDGYSQKGPQAEQASYYYSQPQLAVRASLRLDGTTREATGIAWLDHEWSSSVLDADAVGWDWIGMNLADGSALTAFQIRSKDTGRVVYAYASLRAAGGVGAHVCRLTRCASKRSRPGVRRAPTPPTPSRSAFASAIAHSRPAR